MSIDIYDHIGLCKGMSKDFTERNQLTAWRYKVLIKNIICLFQCVVRFTTLN